MFTKNTIATAHYYHECFKADLSTDMVCVCVCACVVVYMYLSNMYTNI